MATGPIDDLATLEALDEAAILSELKKRYAHDAIYVSTPMAKISSKLVSRKITAKQKKTSGVPAATR